MKVIVCDWSVIVNYCIALFFSFHILYVIVLGLDAWFGRTKAEWQLATRYITFVDIIHTDAGVLGHRESVGHADYFPNGGISPQPGCELAAVFGSPICSPQVR